MSYHYIQNHFKKLDKPYIYDDALDIFDEERYLKKCKYCCKYNMKEVDK